MKIAVIGSGYVGLVSAACLAEIGHDVICVDVDESRVRALRSGEIPVFEHLLPELIGRHRGRRLHFTERIEEAVDSSSVIFIAVGTPSAENGEADLSYVEAVARDLAKCAKTHKVIVEKSTVPVYTCEWIGRVLATSPHQTSFDVVSNPEFLSEGTAVSDFLAPDRIVVGADSPRAAEILSAIYEPLTSGHYYRRTDALVKATVPARLLLTRVKSAELIKHASNAFLAMKVSFINAVSALCEQVGADVQEVALGIGADSRIGAKFLRPSLGFGGSCFPKDVKAFASVAREFGVEFGLLQEVCNINRDQGLRFVRKVQSAIWNLKGKQLAALGLAYKGGTDDVRESPAIAVIRQLTAAGSLVRVFDPAAMRNAAAVLPGEAIQMASDPYHAAEGADALLILTDWDEFRNLDFVRLHKLLKQPVIIDGRNLFDPEVVQRHGFTYHSVGRATVFAASPELSPRLAAHNAELMVARASTLPRGGRSAAVAATAVGS